MRRIVDRSQLEVPTQLPRCWMRDTKEGRAPGLPRSDHPREQGAIPGGRNDPRPIGYDNAGYLNFYWLFDR